MGAFGAIFLVWEIIQVLVGAVVLLFFAVQGKCKRIGYYMRKDAACSRAVILFKIDSEVVSGGSFGHIIILNQNYFYNEEYLEKTKRHELGHSIQSLMLGPFYLFVVGIPSLINNLRARKNKEVYDTYYQRYPEKWADKLGAVDR